MFESKDVFSWLALFTPNQFFFILLMRPLSDTFVNHYYEENKATVRQRVCTLLKQIERINTLINILLCANSTLINKQLIFDKYVDSN